MSVESVALVLNHSRATGSAKLVLIGIANHDGDGGSWPSIATLARYAGIHERGVQRHIKELIELGEIERHINDGGTHKTPDHMRPNLYRVLIKCPADCDGTTAHRVTETPPPDTSATSPLTPAPPLPVASAPPEPSLEPEEEPSVAARAKRATRATTFPASFAVDEEMITWANSVLPGIDLNEVTAAFKNHHLAKGSKFVDWRRAWKNWVTNEKKFMSQRAPKQQQARNDIWSAPVVPYDSWD